MYVWIDEDEEKRERWRMPPLRQRRMRVLEEEGRGATMLREKLGNGRSVSFKILAGKSLCRVRERSSYLNW